MMSSRFAILAIGVSLSLCQVAKGSEDASWNSRTWPVVSSVAANIVPGWSAFVSPRCLPGYILCKLSFAGMGTIASGVQIIAGGDVDGARSTLQRAFGGDWIVTPGHIATDRQPDPYPDLARASEDDDELPEF